jgi:hypothetical protein
MAQCQLANAMAMDTFGQSKTGGEMAEAHR